ncbi:hypothetical protein CVV72_05215 [Amycolatopsis sp. TNS106]|nr:hypothetical protein CVV72_05215 [Amycolatopsis sp. TNS106]
MTSGCESTHQAMIRPPELVAQCTPDTIWWLQRPIAVAGSLLFTLPFLLLFERRRTRGAIEGVRQT